MTRPFKGSLSGVYFDIPELDDPANIEAAFSNFADTIPASPAVMTVKTVTADVNPAELNVLYVFEGSVPATLSLIPGQQEGDKIQMLQLQNSTITVTMNNIPYQGPPATTTQFSGLTLLWQASEGRWVGHPFFSSVVLPPASEGGDDTIVHQGRRYHIYTKLGTSFFYAHTDMTVDVFLVGPGGDGAPAGALAGDGGRGGQVVTGQAHVDLMQSFPVVVGANGASSTFRSLTAAPGADGVVDTATPVDAPYSLPADLAFVLKYAEVGGSGQADSGPVVPATYGRGGGGAHKTVAAVARPSHVVNHAGSPGSSYYVDTTYQAREERYEDGGHTIINGATAVCYYPNTTLGGDGLCRKPDGTVVGGASCPGGWWVAEGMGHCQTSVPTYSTRWICDNGGTNNQDGWCRGGYTVDVPGTAGWSETVWDPCPSGYKVGSDTTTCVDARGVGPGEGGDGVVVISYPTP